MIFHKTKLDGLFLIEPELYTDERGWFARFFCKEEFAKAGVSFDIAQVNRSFTKQKAAIRGLHYQTGRAWEAKVVACAKGAIYNVAVDMRENSPTLGQWEAFELTGENKKMLYTPKGFANGFQALSENCELLYFMSDPYSPGTAAGVRYSDPKLNISWPLENPTLSEKDKTLPHFDAAEKFHE